VWALAQDILQEQDFPERYLLQRASKTPEELLSGAPFRRRLLKKRTRLSAPFKQLSVKTTFMININLIRNNSIEPNHQ
jgi:hypothetical protein